MRLWSGVLAFAWSAGCGNGPSADGEHVARTREAVESTGLGVFYGLAFEPAPSLDAVSAEHSELSEAEQIAIFARELAVQGEPAWASGVITIPALGSGGARLFAPAPATNAIRYSCGITLVSPSYAVTAGHCVESDSDVNAIKLRMYRTTRQLAESYTPAVLSGTFPSYTQPQLSAADGLLFDEYDCSIVNRCYGGSGIQCPAPSYDSAVLHCEGRPGDKYGFLSLNRGGDPIGKEALMHWKHEVLDLGAAEEALPLDRFDHYVMLEGEARQNYHYFDGAADLLPLRSISWANGNPTAWVSSIAADMHGCHGSSGSGMLVRVGETPVYELVGPVVHGGPQFEYRLCERVPNPGGPMSGEGTPALAIDGLDPDVLLSLSAEDIAADCRSRTTLERDVTDLPFEPGSHAVSTLFDHLSCQLDDFGADGTVAAAPSFGPYPEKFVETPSGTEHAIGGFVLDAGADYRVGAEVMPRAACTDACGLLTFGVGGQSLEATPDASDPSAVAVAFAATASGPANLTLENSGQLRALGGIVLIREGQVNSFDSLEDRLALALYALDEEGGVQAGPLPMRFVGDGSAGFQALLFPGERLAVLRQALAPARRWTARLGSSSYDGLKCGFLDGSGAPLASVACAELLRLDDRAGSEARLGFYVELARGGSRASAEIRYLALASDAARDADEDGVPEVLDNCPNDWNAAQADCGEEPDQGGGGQGGQAGEGAGGEISEGGIGGEAAGEGGAEADAGEGGAGASGGSGPAGSAGVAGGGTGATAGASGSGNAGGGGAVAGAGAPGGSPAGGAAGNANSGTGAAEEPSSGRKQKNDSGCGCRLASEERQAGAGWLGLALAGVLARRRRARQNAA